MATVQRHQGAILYWVMVFVMALAISWTIVGLTSLTDRVDEAEAGEAAEERAKEEAEAASAERQVMLEELVGSVEALRDQVTSLGGEPVAPPPEDLDDLPDVDTPAPDVIVRAPKVAEIQAAVSAVISSNPSFTQPQIIAAVTQYLIENPPEDGEDGTDGTDGEDGRDPTFEEIGVVVAAFCAGDTCKGDQGDTGPEGPGPTQEQLDATIVAYCDARGECRGEPGEDGEDGRGIISVDCVDTEDGSTEWLFTFNLEPLEERVVGPCRFEVPGPDPTLTP